MKALIVDDNSLIRGVIRTFLEELQHEVLGEEENGDDAIRSFTALRPDLVLLDMVIPGKTGMEVLEEIRKIDPKAKVLVITALEQECLDKDLLQKGAAAILRKPFTLAEFKAAVLSVV